MTHSNDQQEEVSYECTECHSAVGKDDKICAKCGASLEDIVTEAAASKEEELSYECTECHSVVGKDDKICAQCGASLEEIVNEAAKSTKPGFSIYRVALFAIMLLFGYFVSISALVLLGGSDAKTLVWLILTEQREVEWWREILILHPIFSGIVNATIVFGIYSYLFPDKKSTE